MPAERRSQRAAAFDAAFDRYHASIAPTLAFLQGRDPTLAHRIATRGFLPEGPRFATLDVYVDPGDPQGEHGGDPLAWAFGALGQQDRARHLATLYLNDIADVLRDAVDPRFEFVRYAESLAMSQPSFEPLGAGAGRAAQSGRPHAAGAGAAGRASPPADGGAGVGALPRHGVRRLPHRAGDQGGAARRYASRSAAASSTPNCAS